MKVDLDRNGKEKRWIYDLLGLLFEFISASKGFYVTPRFVSTSIYHTLSLILIITEAR